MSFNLSVILRESARRSPENPAIIDTGGGVSYRDLDSRSDHIASGLVRLGIQPGDAVGVQLPNVREFVEIMYGILKAGAVLVPFNVLNKGPEIAYALTDADVKVLIASASTAGEALRGTAEAGSGRSHCRWRRSPAHGRPTVHGVGRNASAHAAAVRRLRSRHHGCAAVHLRHDRQAQRRRADPLPAVHERPRARRGVRDGQRHA